MNAYQVLGVETDADERAIKRAYAGRIKQYRPDSHPAEFAQVRAAYEDALRWLNSRKQWEEQQQAEESVAEPVATVPVDLETLAAESALELESKAEPVLPAAQPAEFDRKFISEQLSRLEEIATHGSEQEILTKYHELSALMVTKSLDQQMEYEQALLYWTLTTQHPSLLLFAEINKRYDWTSDSIAISRANGEYAGYRLDALSRLCLFLEEARKQNNPFNKIKGQSENRSPWIAAHIRMRIAKQSCTNWDRACDSAGLSDLRGYLGLQKPKTWQIYWVDIFIGMVAAKIAWMNARDQQKAPGWLVALAAGTLVACLPMLVRAVVGWIDTKPMKTKEQIYKYTPKLFMATIIILMFASVGADSGGALLSLIVVMVIAFMANGVYEFLAALEVILMGLSLKVIRLIQWVGKVLQVVARNLSGLRSVPVSVGRDNELEQLKIEFLTTINRASQIIWAYLKTVRWWSWIIILWFSVSLITAILK